MVENASYMVSATVSELSDCVRWHSRRERQELKLLYANILCVLVHHLKINLVVYIHSVI